MNVQRNRHKLTDYSYNRHTSLTIEREKASFVFFHVGRRPSDAISIHYMNVSACELLVAAAISHSLKRIRESHL